MQTSTLCGLDRTEILEKIAAQVETLEPLEGCLASFPHEVIRANMDQCESNLQYRIAQGDYTESSDGVFTAGQVVIHESVVTDTADGPIVIEDGSKILPFAYLRGPVYVGRDCRINEHASIKDAVSLSHTVKVGGEVEGVVIESYSNKQHYGFLGHSYLGSWINLGAGTCNSDLKNTYGKVNVQYPQGKIGTGMQFVGCAMGDYSKSAINTSIFTGKMIGVGEKRSGHACLVRLCPLR